MNFGQLIKELRLEKGLTQQQVAEKVGCKVSSISFWENNIYEPKLTYIINLAKFFEVSADYLLGLENEFGDTDYEVNKQGITLNLQQQQFLKMFNSLSDNAKQYALSSLKGLCLIEKEDKVD